MEDRQLELSDVFCVTVTFNPDLELIEKQINALSSECNIILIDNGSENIDSITLLAAEFSSVELLSLGQNLGIAVAQNIAAKRAIALSPHCRFLLFLDHDSVPGPNMLATLVKEFDCIAAEDSKIGALGPVLQDARTHEKSGFHVVDGLFWRSKLPDGDQPLKIASLNSSGSLLSVEVFLRTGGFAEELFVDHVDTEWAFRAMDTGFSIYGTSKVYLEHRMGDEVVEYWLFGKRTMPYRSPIRHYYIARNSVLLQKKPYVMNVWKVWNLVKLVFTYSYFGFFSKNRGEHRRAIRQGIVDGFRGVSGSFHSENS